MVDDLWVGAGVIIIILIVAGFFIFSGNAGDENNVGTTDIREPTDYGNGVYYFAVSRSTFANSLSAFLSKNKNMTCVAISGDGSGGYGSDLGYFVVVR